MRDLQRVLNDEKRLFYSDLSEYKNSLEGLEVQQFIKDYRKEVK